MIGKIRDWYRALSRREQIMVGILGVLVGIAVLIYGIILPVGRANDAAYERYALALDNSGSVTARLAVLDRGAGTGGGVDQPVHLYVATSAGDKGFELSSNQPRGNDATTIAIASASPTAFFAWVAELERAGIILETLTVRQVSPGTVSVNASFRKAG